MLIVIDSIMLRVTGIGEPPICMSIVIAFAIREAIVAARQESGISPQEWFQESKQPIFLLPF